MPFYPKRYRKRRPRIGRKARKTTYRKRVAKISKPMKNAIKNVVHRMAENKSWSQTSAAGGQNLSSSIIGATSLLSVQPWSMNLLPNIAQGTGSSGRIGNRVRLVKNNIRGHVSLLPFNSTTNTYQAPIVVKLYVFSMKTFSNFVGDLGFANWQQFLRVNNNDTGFYGSVLDLSMPVNPELITLHKTKTFQLAASLSGTITVPNAVYQSQTGSYIVPFNFNLIKYAKDLKFDDANSNRVTNKSLFMCAQVVYADGSLNSYTVDSQHCKIFYIQEAEYEDL